MFAMDSIRCSLMRAQVHEQAGQVLPTEDVELLSVMPGLLSPASLMRGYVMAHERVRLYVCLLRVLWTSRTRRTSFLPNPFPHRRLWR